MTHLHKPNHVSEVWSLQYLPFTAWSPDDSRTSLQTNEQFDLQLKLFVLLQNRYMLLVLYIDEQQQTH